ncbi:hypothetical protein AXG93_154s1980 [Marchantia polymorpha subsp. ruderalis]|uniref:Uncharacterized protein n=1 Tax=Marchantia polymorpha subsp. ruderalis TaxID=1480154 RepID=A0A176VJZ1_MARPO|nr:hypothetical protein AXG93_154s1980 [Marchantia polymorpha subsp. ruderalis]
MAMQAQVELGERLLVAFGPASLAQTHHSSLPGETSLPRSRSRRLIALRLIRFQSGRVCRVRFTGFGFAEVRVVEVSVHGANDFEDVHINGLGVLPAIETGRFGFPEVGGRREAFSSALHLNAPPEQTPTSEPANVGLL